MIYTDIDVQYEEEDNGRIEMKEWYVKVNEALLNEK